MYYLIIIIIIQSLFIILFFYFIVKYQCAIFCAFMPYPLPPMTAKQSSHLRCSLIQQEISGLPFTGSIKNETHSVMYLRSK